VHTGVVHGLSCVCTDHTVVVHAGVVHGLSCICTYHTVVVHTGVFMHYRVFVLTMQLLYTQVWFMDDSP
jgi:hypothetical protein